CSARSKDRRYLDQLSETRCSSILEHQNPHPNPQSYTPNHSSADPLSTPSRKSQESTPLSSACSPAPPANHDGGSEEPLIHDGFFPNVSRQSVLGCPCYPLERLLPKLRVHHRPADIPAQPPDIAHAHRAENLDQLIMPSSKEIHETLRTPSRINSARPQLVAVPVSSLAKKLRLQSNENRRINADKIRPTNNRLRNMLCEGYTTTLDDCDLVPESFFH